MMIESTKNVHMQAIDVTTLPGMEAGYAKPIPTPTTVVSWIK